MEYDLRYELVLIKVNGKFHSLYLMFDRSTLLTMKTSKTGLKTQEECGVWLDPAQLKGRAKQVGFFKLWTVALKYEQFAICLVFNTFR